MKKVIKIIIILLIVVFALKLLIRVDSGPVENIIKEKSAMAQGFKPDFANPKTVTLDGVDYMQTQAPVGEFGGKLVSSSIGEGPKTFNFWNSKDSFSSTMGAMMFDGLVYTSPYTGEALLKMAKDIKILPDKKTYIVELRHNLKWSDGKEITADDVFYTWNTIVFGGFGNTSSRDSLYIKGKLPAVEKLGKYKIKFVTPEPFAPFLLDLSLPIAPKHVFKPVTDKGHDAFNSFWSSNTKPEAFVASGPFIVQEYVPAQRVVFKRNSNYYLINKDNQKLPYLNQVVILIVGDLNNELLKFKAGEIDVLGLRGSDISSFKEKEKNSDYKMYNLGPSTSTMFITFNLNPRKNPAGKYYVNPMKQKWFNDINFRAAVDWALDRENMIFNIANGAAQPLFTPEPLASIYLNKSIAKGHPRDIEYSKELLKKSGFYLNDKGILHDKAGNTVEFDLLTNAGNTERETIGVMVKQDLEDLGITVNFKPVEFNNLVNKVTNTCDFDAVIIGLTGGLFEPNNGKNVWMSNGVLHLFNKRFQRDFARDDRYLWEKRLDAIFNQGALELTFKDRKKYYDEYQKIVYDEKPIIYLYSPLQISAVRKKLGNIFPSTFDGVTHNTAEIYVKSRGTF